MSNPMFGPSIEYLPVIAYALHADDRNRMRYISPRVTDVLGYTPRECTSEPAFFFQRTHPDDQALVQNATKHAFQTGEPFGLEYRIRSRDGHYVWVRDDAIAFADEFGRLNLWQGVIIDITSRIGAETALRLALAAAKMGTWDWDLETGELAWSAETEQLHGRPAGSFSSRFDDFLHDLHPEDQARVERAVTETLTSGDDYEAEYRVVTEDNGTIWEFAKGRVIRDAHGRPVRMTGVTVDITERKRAEDERRRGEERFRALVQYASDIIAITDVTGVVLYVSPSIEGVLGIPAADIIGTSSFSFHHPDDQERVQTAIQSLAQRPGGTVALEMRVLHADTTWRWLETKISNHLDQPGIAGLVVNARDITERKRAEQQIRETEARYRVLVEQTAAMMYIEDVDSVDGSRHLRYVSPQIQSMLGYAVDEWMASPQLWADSLHVDDRERVAQAVEIAHQTLTPLRLEYRRFDRTGRVVWFRDEALALIDPVDGMIRWQGVLHDITERKQMEAQLEHQAFHDALTGLPNRVLFSDRLGHALLNAVRQSKPAAVLFLDLDRFKMINDSLGHEAGDRLLIEAGERITRCLRAGDTVARLGGDEFAVLLTNTDNHDAQTVANRILAQLHLPFQLASQEVVVSASIGISLSSPQASPDELLRSADLALYQAKQAGRATAITFQPGMSIWPSSRVRLERDLHRAIERNELQLVYQPIFELATMQPVAFEALIRWHHPKHGVIPPADFLPIAEETGLISQIGHWTFNEACTQFRHWHDGRSFDVVPSINVNVSRRQLRDPLLVEQIIQTLARHAVPAHALRLEIAEETLVDDLPAILSVLGTLRDLGVSLAIDDFGAGATSLTSLRDLPVQQIKLDKSFIQSTKRDQGVNEDIVAAVTALAHRLGQTVTSEGIETPDQLDAVRRGGCDFGQGYLLGLPGSAESIFERFMQISGVR